MADTPWYAPDHVVPHRGPASGRIEPLWRMRKQAQTVDARLRHQSEGSGGGVEIQFLYDGEFVYGRRWPTREPAVAEADAKRQELAIAGWMLHW